jgi:hypothetical protein
VANERAVALPESRDNRAAPRFPVTANTDCQFALPLLTDLGPVRIENISMNGIGLQMRDKVDVGAILVLGIRNTPKAFDRVYLLHVVHVTPRPGGYFLVGGTLDPPLTYSEFVALVT